MSKTGNGKVKVDVAVLHEKVVQITQDVSEIKLNHLPHIYNKLNSIEIKIAYYVGGVAVLGFLLQIVLKFIK